MTTFLKKHEALVYSAVGLAALFLLLVAFNYLASTAAVRADLTEGKLYTLSGGTKKVLKNLQAPVKVKLYVTTGEAMPVQLRSYAQRVEDLVREFKSAAGANLVVEKYNPRPDSEEEDAAQLDGMEPQQLASGEQFYLGLAVSQLDRKQPHPGALAGARAAARVRPDPRHRARGRRRAPEDRPDERPAGARRALQPDDAPELRAVGARQRAAARLRGEAGQHDRAGDRQGHQRPAAHPPARHRREGRVRARPVRAARRQAHRLRRSLRLLRPGAGADPRHAGHGLELDPAAPVQGLGRGDGAESGRRRGVRLGRRAALHAHGAVAQPHRVRARRRRDGADRDAALRLRRRLQREACRGPRGERAREELAQLDAGGHRAGHRVGRWRHQVLPAGRQEPAARAAPFGQVQDRVPGGQARREDREAQAGARRRRA